VAAGAEHQNFDAAGASRAEDEAQVGFAARPGLERTTAPSREFMSEGNTPLIGRSQRAGNLVRDGFDSPGEARVFRKHAPEFIKIACDEGPNGCRIRPA
jgi:hypothetical protein